MRLTCPSTFFDALRVLLAARVSVVAEAAFQDRLWRTGLEPLIELAQIRVVHCAVDREVAWERAQRRRHRAAHADGAHMKDLESWIQWFASFERVSIPAPSIVVDTTDGYAPGLPEIVEFVNRPGVSG